jgi:D-xylose reductase
VVIPKTVKHDRLVENISIFDFTLTADEMSAISALNKNERYNDPGTYTEPAFKNFYPIFE